jgi:hypothetical protein
MYAKDVEINRNKRKKNHINKYPIYLWYIGGSSSKCTPWTSTENMENDGNAISYYSSNTMLYTTHAKEEKEMM